MKKKIFILLCSLVFLSNIHVSAKSPTTIENLDKLADTALQLTKLGRFVDAEKILEQFQEEFSEAATDTLIFSMDEIKILLTAQNEAKRALSEINKLPEEKINKVTKLRLAVDAMHSHYQPLWTELQEPIMSAFSQIKEAVKAKDLDVYQMKLNSFLTRYSLIEPSLKIDIPVAKIQRLDAEITFIDKYREKIMEDDTQFIQLDMLEADLQNVFDHISEDETDPSIWWVIITTGSIIILTLSYVGWRKYKGETHTKQKEHND
ncbi:sporulation protein YpjB [Heyndrickxia sp. NPDC080065]|uniref:sporulation protein YpjB n=1 Tax=Heyndrickxia sp. NPDC080065 TaxID=3390568 RepID=UPI003D06D446